MAFSSRESMKPELCRCLAGAPTAPQNAAREILTRRSRYISVKQNICVCNYSIVKSLSVPVFVPVWFVFEDPAVVLGLCEAGCSGFIDDDGAFRVELQRRA